MYDVFCAASGLRDELITPVEETYRVCVCVIVCDLETSTIISTRYYRTIADCSIGLSRRKHESADLEHEPENI